MSIGIIPELWFGFPLHKHTSWEIVYYLEGTGCIQVGKDKIPFEPGDILCLPPCVPHSESSESGFKNIYFTVGNIGNVPEELIKFRDTEGKDFYIILMQLYKEFHRKQLNWWKITDGLLDVLLQYMNSWREKRNKNILVEKLENTLLVNISNTSFSIEDAVKSTPLSEDYIRILFKKETGKTPVQYLTQKRIHYAESLIKTNYDYNMKMIEIARMSGFKDPYYFSRTFKKVTGCCPTEYQRKELP